MGLLDKQEKTQEEKIHDLRTEITKVSTRLYSKMQRRHMELFNLIWENPEGLTAQEIFDEYGADAKDFFIMSQGIQGLLYQAGGAYTPLAPPYEYTLNTDGTVTVHDDEIS